jgi:hypothetical protein
MDKIYMAANTGSYEGTGLAGSGRYHYIVLLADDSTMYTSRYIKQKEKKNKTGEWRELLSQLTVFYFVRV